MQSCMVNHSFMVHVSPFPPCLPLTACLPKVGQQAQSTVLGTYKALNKTDEEQRNLSTKVSSPS